MKNEFHKVWIPGSRIRDEFLKWVCSESERKRKFFRSGGELEDLFSEWLATLKNGEKAS